MSFSVTPAQVRKFEIDDHCMNGTPCNHHCKITLIDRRSKELYLFGNQIYALVNSLYKNRIKGDCDHFKGFKDFKNSESFSLPGEKTKTVPQEILSHIFKK